jgi:hypothetical protein
MTKLFSEREAVAEIGRLVKKAGSEAEFARGLGVCRALVNLITTGRRRPTRQFLEKLGFTAFYRK